ncbi:hypothetical protein K432DRAFT_311896 [Lepidopterella palustris CBS 459.81]|uniref:Tc1-like transposase DDE domain-containing protein n=1 Tax=Lepidopterella palustris CBS 459.81 TaxID=1314670 RepID=A0A8E2DYA0_9PEZI|nr:hypothetical protein K432DRAFT_311896 [Lepidopterella palustris CBS 459.81]
MWFPANSPDLNPIKHLKDAVYRRQPRTSQEMRQVLQEEWEALDLSEISRICRTMRARCEAVIAAAGGPTKW